MPYLITTYRHLNDPTAEFLPGALPGVERLAVATLEEAREETALIVAAPDHDESWDEHARDAYELPESGGTITLSDETEIRVEPCGWAMIADAIGWSMLEVAGDRAGALHAYNALSEARQS